MLTFKEYIFLIEATGEQLYKQVYGKKIPWETFYKIVSGDIERVEDKNIAKDLGYDKVQDYLWKGIPQTQFNGEDISNVGTKAKWVLGLWLNDEFEPSEDTLRDVYNAYTIYNITKSKKLKNTPFENFRKVEHIKSVSDLMKIDRYIKNNINSTKKTSMADSANDIDVIFENEEWKVLIPLTYRSSKLYGFQKCKAKWCTASSESIFYYNEYIVTNYLYIFFNKEDPKSSFQMGFEEGEEDPEFNDTDNEEYNLDTFREDNEELKPTIQEILDEWNKILNNKEYEQNKMFERFKKTKSPNIPYNMIKRNGNIEIIKKMLKYLPKNVLRQKILIDDDPIETKWDSICNIIYRIENEKLIEVLEELIKSTINKDNINDIYIYNKEYNQKRRDLGLSDNEIREGMLTALKFYDIKDYDIKYDLSLYVNGNFDMRGSPLKSIPFIFTDVTGDFRCSYNKLESLEGGPQKVGGTFYCSDNKLESLEGAPQEIGGTFYCPNNELESLEGGPQKVGGDFYCSDNKLESLEGAPQEVGGTFYCPNNELESLEGAPQEVGGTFYCSDNKLESLEGGPQKVGGDFYCPNNELTSLKGGPQEIGGNLHCHNNKLESLEGAPQEVRGDFYCFNNKLESLEGGPQKVGGNFYCPNNELTSFIGAPQKVGGDFISYDNDDLTQEEINRYKKSIGKG